MLQNGGSWSGHERNCCFLNTKSDQFADVSSITGLDHASDSRSLAMVDWDQDGDLDIWCSNRTAPRIRYLQNNNDAITKNSSILIKLQGTESNRDAIGARVELETTLDGKSQKSIQTLRAGEGYLAQSSKWLHFGLGESEPVVVIVRWPNGNEQAFANLERNKRYRLVEGKDIEEHPVNRAIKLPNAMAIEPKIENDLRIIPARRIPLPNLNLMDADGKPFRLSHDDQKLKLLTIWATWCQPCVEELSELEKNVNTLAKQDIKWIPINVDELESGDIERQLQISNAHLSRINVSTPTAFATRSAVECLDATQRVLTARKTDLPIPCSFLIDRRGHLMAVYKGTVSAAQVESDVQQLQELSADPRDGTIPFAGKWSMNTFPVDLMAIPTRLADIGRSVEAFEYLVENVPTDSFEPPITRESLSDAYAKLGREFVQKRQMASAESALKYALKVNAIDVQARMGLAEVLLLQKKYGEAVGQYREILKLADRQPMTLNNLAWILATSEDESIRSPAEAMTFAERLCEVTGRAEPVSLDTLSVALAANGQFEKAVTTLEAAISLAKDAGKPIDRMEKRLELFRNNRTYTE